VGAAVLEIVPLVGEQHAVRLGLAELVGEAARDVLVVVGIGVGDRRHLDQDAPDRRSRSFFSWLWVSGMTMIVR
jgi:hypothetical protein